MKTFWGKSVCDMLFSDDSAFKLQRFPQFIKYLQTYLESCFEDIFEAIPEKWNVSLEEFFNFEDINGRRGGIKVHYDFTRSQSVLDVTWDGKELAHALLIHLVNHTHLVSYHRIQREVYAGIESYFRHLEDNREPLVEDHSVQRSEIEMHVRSIDHSIQGILAILNSSNWTSLESSRVQTEVDLSTISPANGVVLDSEKLTLRSVGLDITLLKKNNFTPKQFLAGGFSALEVMGAGKIVCTPVGVFM